MPRIDSEGDVIVRVTGIEKGPMPQTAVTPKYLIVRGTTPIGPLELLISEQAARDLRTKLARLLPVVEAE
jgi:hypothetical protein